MGWTHNNQPKVDITLKEAYRNALVAFSAFAFVAGFAVAVMLFN